MFVILPDNGLKRKAPEIYHGSLARQMIDYMGVEVETLVPGSYGIENLTGRIYGIAADGPTDWHALSLKVVAIVNGKSTKKIITKR